jgi:prepilin-type processing-associated H-X9-DG protein
MFTECAVSKQPARGAPVIGGMAVSVSSMGPGESPAQCYARRGANGILTGEAGGVNGEGTFDRQYAHGQGRRWGDSLNVYTAVLLVMPPNSPSCSGDQNTEAWGMPTASSYHPGGVNAVMCDGAVRFFSNTINAGDPAASIDGLGLGIAPQHYTGPSLRGVWGAMGSMKGREAISSNP